MSEQQSNHDNSYNAFEDSQQELEYRRDELVRKIWKTFGEKGLLVFLPIFLGFCGAVYVEKNKDEIDKTHNLACYYHEDAAEKLKQFRKYGSFDCSKTPSTKLIGDSILAGIYTSTTASFIAQVVLFQSKRIAKHIIKDNQED